MTEENLMDKSLDKKPLNLSDLDDEIKKEIYELSKAMTLGIRKWEKLIYPMIVAFIILAAYGFYLIYNVTNDMSKMSKNVAEMASTTAKMNESIVQVVTIMGIQMSKIDYRMGGIHESMMEMEEGISSMSTDMVAISSMDASMKQINNTLNGIYQSVYFMGQTTGQMNSNFSELNENISKPLDSMNNVMPWSMFGSKKYTNHKNRRQAIPVPIYSPYNDYLISKEAKK